VTLQTLPLFAPIAADLQTVVDKLRSAADIEDQLLDEALAMVVAAGGKLIRPALAITATNIYGADHAKTISLAASVEMLHTATLVHDDMIDDAARRRGMPTLHTLLNPASAVLLGDYLFAQAAAWAAETDNVRVVNIFAATLMTIVEGELRQMWAKRNLQRSEENYYERIHGKTAALFAAACEAGGVLGGAPEVEVQALREYGRLLGLAFQIVDDVLDFVGDEQKLGKPVGGDLRSGNITLPLIFYLHDDHHTWDDLAQDLFEGRRLSDEQVRTLVERVVGSPAIERSLREARHLASAARRALTPIPASPHCSTLVELTDYVVRRRH